MEGKALWVPLSYNRGAVRILREMARVFAQWNFTSNSFDK